MKHHPKQWENQVDILTSDTASPSQAGLDTPLQGKGPGQDKNASLGRKEVHRNGRLRKFLDANLNHKKNYP